MTRVLEYLQRQWIRVTLGALVTLVFLAHVSGVVTWRLLVQLENIAYDARLVATMPEKVDERIVILDIDERSLAEEGRWPWGRDRMAVMVDQLFDRYKVALVGFDVVFAEPDDSSGLKILEQLAETALAPIDEYHAQLEQLRPTLDHDAMFARAVAGRPVILGYYFNEHAVGDKPIRSGALPPPTFEAGMFRGKPVEFLKAVGFGGNLPELQEAAMGAGHFNPWVDDDGVVRRVPMLYEFEGAHYEGLSLAMARAVIGDVPLQPGFAPPGWGSGGSYAGLEWLRLGERMIPVDERVRALVPYRGMQGSFPYVSAADVIHGRADPALLEGRIVLVGTTAPGLLDLRSTPVQSAYPGVEIHANLISGILSQTLKERPAYIRGAEFVLVLFLGLLMALGLPALTPLWATLATLGLALATVSFNLLVWSSGNLVLPIAASMVLMLALFVVNMSYGYFIETRGKRQLTGLFGQYVPPELVDEMARDPESYSLEAASREMTVLFSDVRGFTTISEGLSAKDLAQLMNEFLTPMTQVIHRHRGTIDKYMGDAIMAFWGAPVEDPAHARHALHAAMEMLEALERLQPQFKARGWPELHIGIGINTGVMSVGNMGSEFRMAYTVMGDEVNLGSRLEGLTKTYRVALIVSESTMRYCPEFAYRELDRVRVKGKDKPVAIYEPLCAAQAVDRALKDELALYQQALKYYRAQDWDMAELQFLNLEKMSPRRGRLYRMYAERVAHFRQHPPEAGWDGVFTFTSK